MKSGILVSTSNTPDLHMRNSLPGVGSRHGTGDLVFFAQRQLPFVPPASRDLQCLKRTTWTISNDNKNEVDMNWNPVWKTITSALLYAEGKGDCKGMTHLSLVLPDRRPSLSSICSILRPRGIYVCSTWNHIFVWRKHETTGSWPNWLPWRFFSQPVFWLQKHFTTVHLAQPDQKLMW